MTWRRALLYAGLATWLAMIVGTLALVWRYKLTPGELAEAPARWPTTSALVFEPGVANVVMFAHPQCPCTRASMTELARLADELHGRARVHVVLLRPADAEAGFEDGAIRDRAVALGADVVVDVDGSEAARFGAVVSGSTVVYASDGALVFRGGITIARGHEGRGPAHDQIVSAITVHDGVASAPTYGCSLFAEANP
jgi:hypothetical protein